MNSGLNHNPICQLEHVTKVYGSRVVLEVERLSLQPGEILAVVGPSGAGKSTLLRLLSFLEAPTTGTLIFHGQPVSTEKEISLLLRRRVTMVFQRPLLLNRSIEANVHFGLELRGIRRASDTVITALEQVGLTHLRHQKANILSGGEAQRVALARAIVLQPDVLLLDEPTANLDPYNVGVIENVILQLNHQQRTTLVLVTHNVFQAKRLANRAAFLLDGRVIEDSDAASLFTRPTDPRTAAFVRGEMVC